MLWLYLIALALLGLVVMILVGKIPGAAGDGEPSGQSTDHVTELLDQRDDAKLTSADLKHVTFDPAPRGYRMDQVDSLLDALQAQLREAEKRSQR